MQFYEIPELVKGLNLKSRESWEQTRLLAYMTAQVNSTKKIKPTDILQFEWDCEKEPDDKEKTISKADVKRLSKKTDEVLKKLKKNG